MNRLLLRYGILDIEYTLYNDLDELKSKLVNTIPNGIMLRNSIDISKSNVEYMKLIDFIQPHVLKYFDKNLFELTLTRVVLINYSVNGDIKLDKHIDDSVITLSYCVYSDATGSEIEFFDVKKLNNCVGSPLYPTIKITPETSHIYVHYGNNPHQTHQLTNGCRYNIVMWFK
jgi:hypothetical protein